LDGGYSHFSVEIKIHQGKDKKDDHDLHENKTGPGRSENGNKRIPLLRQIRRISEGQIKVEKSKAENQGDAADVGFPSHIDRFEGGITRRILTFGFPHPLKHLAANGGGSSVHGEKTFLFYR
jgi:hypothetical protein